MRSMRVGHFAASSPDHIGGSVSWFKEKRLCGFSDDNRDDTTVPANEGANESPESAVDRFIDNAGSIDPLRQETSEQTRKAIPEMENVIGAPEIWYYTLSHANLWNMAQHKRVADILGRAAGRYNLRFEQEDGGQKVQVDPSIDPVSALRTMNVVQDGPQSQARKYILSELLSDPEFEIQFIGNLEDPISHCNRRDKFAQEEHIRSEGETDEEYLNNKLLFARTKILRHALPKLEAELGASKNERLAALLGRDETDIPAIEELLNTLAQNIPELTGAWRTLKEENIERISFTDKSSCIRELVGIQSDLRKEPAWDKDQTDAMKNHVHILKLDLQQKINAKANKIHTKTVKEVQSFISESKKHGDLREGDNMLKFEKAFEQEHGVSFDEALTAANHIFDTGYCADREKLERTAKGGNGASENEQQDAQLRLARLQDGFLPDPNHPDFLERAGSLVKNLNKYEDKSVIETAKKFRNDTDILIANYGQTFDQASQMLTDDSNTFDQTKAVLGEEMAKVLRDNEILQKDGIPIQMADLPANLAQLKYFAEDVISGAIWRMDPIEDVQKSTLDRDLETKRKELIEKLEDTKEALGSLSNVSSLKWLKLDKAVMQEYRTAEGYLKDYIPACENEKKATQTLNLVDETVDNLTTLAKFIEAGHQVVEDTSISVKGKCVISNDPNTPVIIVINPDRFKSGDTKESIVGHEWGHALVHMITTGTKIMEGAPVFEDILNDVRSTEEGRKALKEAEEAWGIKGSHKTILEFWYATHDIDPPSKASASDKRKAEAYYNQKLAEELVMSFSEMKEEQNRQGPDYDPGHDSRRFHAATRNLWNVLNTSSGSARTSYLSESEATALNKLNTSFATMEMFAADDEADEDADDADTSGTESETEAANEAGAVAATPEGEKITSETSVFTKLENIKFQLHKINEIANIPMLKQNQGLLENRDRIRTMYNRSLHIYRNGDDPETGRTVENPETDPWFTDAIKRFNEYVNKYVEDLTKEIKKNRDLSSEKPRPKTLFEKIFVQTKWVSLMDVKKMVDDSLENMKRMWERRSQRARNHMAGVITDLIPDNDIPLLSYLGRLKYEVRRQEQDNEQEEVGVWEKAFEHLGPIQLLQKLSDVKSNQDRDKMKAIMNLLAKVGRIDWENEKIWDALSKLSNYDIPHEICTLDRFTREAWLEKVISDIWPTDTDLFYKWQNSNATSFKSKREEYEDFANVRANTGEMQYELNTQLKLYTEWAIGSKKKGPIPEDVNPYKYEKILHYAMANGKMSMADKFFYLIQGLDVGLLPLERLNVLNAELIKGGFPFIDFFTGKNNSRHEIRQIAIKMRETEEWQSENRYKPGQKAKIWLELVLARDEDTRSRAAKILGARGNEIDHEDIPMLTSILNMSEMDELLKRQGGDRYRVTQEGLKNAYAGFGTVFRTYSQLAFLSKQPNSGVYFAEEDATIFGKRMLSYILFDNIVPGAAAAGRPSLSWGQIEGEHMPSGGDRRPKDFRNTNNEIVGSIIEGFGFGDISIGGDKVVPIKQYVAHLRGGKGGDCTKADLELASKAFEIQFVNTLKDDPERLASILSGFAQRENFYNEGQTIQASEVKLMRQLSAQSN